MSETTDLYKILQIYTAFSQFMQFSKINYKSMDIHGQKLQVYAKYYKAMFEKQ